jgi:hypothetical protein
MGFAVGNNSDGWKLLGIKSRNLSSDKRKSLARNPKTKPDAGQELTLECYVRQERLKDEV